MSEIKRYRLAFDAVGDAVELIESVDGNLVEYSDYAASQARVKELEKQGAGMFLRGIRHAQTLIENDDPCCTLEVLQNDPESYRKGKSHAVGVISKYLKG